MRRAEHPGRRVCEEMLGLRCCLANAMRVVLAALGKPLLQRVEGLTLRATRGLLAGGS